MKKYLKIFVGLVVLFSASFTRAEFIQNYDVLMDLKKDSSVHVKETISYDFEALQKHGIFRYIPLSFDVLGQEKFNGLKKRSLDIKVLSVKKDGLAETFIFDPSDQNNNAFMKIGNAAHTVTGKHVYEIEYIVEGSVRYFDNYDEIYWNAIGDKWDVRIENANVRIISEGIIFDKKACFFGPNNSSATCDTSLFAGNSVSFSQKNISANSAMTVSTSFSKGEVAVVENYSWSVLSYIIAGLLSLVGLIAFAVVRIKSYVNKYKTSAPVYVRYEPPQNFDPIGIGYLIDKQFDQKDLSAGLISLAQKGYITIQRIKAGFLGRADYLFKRTQKEREDLEKINKDLLQALFGTEEEILLSEASGSKLILFRAETSKGLSSFYVKEGYIEKLFNYKFTFNKLPKPVIMIIGFIVINIIFPFFMFVAIPALFIGFIIFSIFSVRYTEKGWQAKNAIEGFKEFLSMTEKDRYETLNNPQDNPQQFMEFLPYAIAMGVEKKWAQQFKTLSIEKPDWYSGSAAFNVGIFASNLSELNSSLSRVATPKSSGSGSGGGGFSGGGSGGGGGGSW